MLNNAQPFILIAWWMSIFPGLALLLTVIAVNLVADGLNEACNPVLSDETWRGVRAGNDGVR
jgi:peptide/nickel transport system permease protein